MAETGPGIQFSTRGLGTVFNKYLCSGVEVLKLLINRMTDFKMSYWQAFRYYYTFSVLICSLKYGKFIESRISWVISLHTFEDIGLLCPEFIEELQKYELRISHQNFQELLSCITDIMLYVLLLPTKVFCVGKIGFISLYLVFKKNWLNKNYQKYSYLEVGIFSGLNFFSMLANSAQKLWIWLLWVGALLVNLEFLVNPACLGQVNWIDS